MQIVPLAKSSQTYSCNSYLILGDWNRLEDLNTVIDPGTDAFVLEQIERLSTGLGKVAVERVILTHGHFDHSGGAAALKRRYGARVLAFAEGPEVDETLRDGQFIKAGDGALEVIYTPGHSSDSICLYAAGARALFSGDIQLKVRGTCDSYPLGHLAGLERLAGKDVQFIYSGHDDPVTKEAADTIRETLALARGQGGAPV